MEYGGGYTRLCLSSLMVSELLADKAGMTLAVSSGLDGFVRAEDLVNETASRIAGQPNGVTREGQACARSTEHPVDLRTQAVNLIQARKAVAANLKNLETANRMQKTVFQILGY